MNVHAGRSNHTADVDREHVVRQMVTVRRDRDPLLRIERLQCALVKLHRRGAGQRPHIDPPGVAGQRTSGRRRRDTAVVEESRREQLHPIPSGNQVNGALHDVQVGVASPDQEQDRHSATSKTRARRWIQQPKANPRSADLRVPGARSGSALQRPRVRCPVGGQQDAWMHARVR